MTRQPVHAPAPRKPAALSARPAFSDRGLEIVVPSPWTYQPDNTKSVEWNRGAYLVEGLAHCGACHTPRNALGAERASAPFAGGDVDNWHAYAINGQSPSPVPWDADALFGYLRHGWHPDHGVARGPMAQVVSNLSSVPESDVRAIATYMAGLFGAPTPDRKRRGDEVLAQAKSAGDRSSPRATRPARRSMPRPARPAMRPAGRCPMAGSISRSAPPISGPDARNAANIVLSGIRPVEGERSPIMPGFADGMSDDQIAALLDYLRARFSNQPAWTGIEKTVADAGAPRPSSCQTSPAPHNAPADATQRDKP